MLLDSFDQNSTESLNAFHHEFDALVDQLKEVEAGTCPDIIPKYNRGDVNQYRFHTSPRPKKTTVLEDQVSRLCKTFIENIEDQGMSSSLKQSLQQNGIYSMLYHHSRTYRSIAYTEMGTDKLKKTQLKLALSAVSVAIFATVSFLGAIILLPLATALFAASMAYISGLLYGILNDILATRSNLAYFILGHQYAQRSFFVSNDLLVQAIGWGVIATEGLAQIAALVFGITVFMTATLSTTPIATFVLALLALTIPLAVLTADLYARYQVQKYMKDGFSLSTVPENQRARARMACGVPEDTNSITLDKINFDGQELRIFVNTVGLMDKYQLDGHALISPSIKDKATWLANGSRNLAGYIGAPLIAIGALIALLSISKTAVPTILFSTLLSTTVPIIVATIVILVLAISVNYALANKDKQIDNKYKLNTSKEPNNKQPDELYLNEDQTKAAITLQQGTMSHPEMTR
ncbi:MAG: hypothetical protein NTU48_03650 [Legionellales bacterium]|nr:hypothetical protein [Legionellales bacterium]